MKFWHNAADDSWRPFVEFQVVPESLDSEEIQRPVMKSPIAMIKTPPNGTVLMVGGLHFMGEATCNPDQRGAAYS